MREDFPSRVKRAAESVRMASDSSPSIGIILGSGLSGIAERIDGAEIAYHSIEGFPTPTVSGHRGVLRIGEHTAVLAGRFHFYEGNSLDNIVLPVFLLHELGVGTLVVTNAAGGINRAYRPGELVLIGDHLNLMGTNPLIGPNDPDAGPRFPDMSHPYSERLRATARAAARRELATGVYAALTGPSYETAAEIRMLERLGADLVGMSTVPEVIAARYLGMEVLGISCVTNMAAGILDRPLDHSEVIATGRLAEQEMTRLILGVIDALTASAAGR